MYIKKRTAIISFCMALCLIFVIIFARSEVKYVYTSPKPNFTVVIDAGHGGIDGGSVGKELNTKESDLNLIYAQRLEYFLRQAGFNVVQTRKTKDGLYSTGTKSYKKDDMKKRKEIIENTNPDLIISIHMNSFPLSSAKGAQTFYDEGNDAGKRLADCIQESFVKNLNNAKKASKNGDYYMVTCTPLPSVIVECGYLSNAEEEKLLISPDYQDKICYSILCGILQFYEFNNY